MRAQRQATAAPFALLKEECGKEAQLPPRWLGSSSNRGWQLARVFGAFIPRQRTEDRVEIAIPQHLRWGIGLPVSGNIFDKLIDDLEADFLVRFLPTTEPEFDAHLHFIAKKLDGVIPLGGQIVRVDRRGDLNLLHLASRRACARFLFGFFVKELAVVYDPAHGRDRLRDDLDQVQFFLLRQPQSVIERHDPERLLLVIDYPDFAGTDLPITAVERFSGTK